MSKLSDVRTALEQNPDIVIVGTPQRDFLPSDSSAFGQAVDFCVARKAGIYDAGELQSFMKSLVPDVTPTNEDQFVELGGDLVFGVLYFDEKIGDENITREINIFDEDAITADFSRDGLLVVEDSKKIMRRTRVRLYPNAEIAALALKGDWIDSIPRRELGEYRRQEPAAVAAG